MKILIIAEHDGSKLNQATARAVTCASVWPGSMRSRSRCGATSNAAST